MTKHLLCRAPQVISSITRASYSTLAYNMFLLFVVFLLYYSLLYSLVLTVLFLFHWFVCSSFTKFKVLISTDCFLVRLCTIFALLRCFFVIPVVILQSTFEYICCSSCFVCGNLHFDDHVRSCWSG